MDQFKRPKIHIAKTKTEWAADVVGYFSLAAMFGLLLLNWGKLPAEVPAHFGATGEVDRWGSKWELLILPIITIALYIFLAIFEKFPETHNYPARFNENNARAFYLNSRQLLNYTKNIINILFTYSVFITVSISLEAETKLGWPFYVILASLFIIMIFKIMKSFKIK